MPKKPTAKSDKSAKTNSETDPGKRVRGWKIAQLAATLATRYSVTVPDIGDPKLDPEKKIRDVIPGGEANKIYDDFYNGILRRAADLLEKAEHLNDPDPYIYAEELFERDRFYSYDEIADTFKEVSWPLLTRRNTIETRINKIFAKVEEQNQELKSTLESGKLKEEDGVNLRELRRKLKTEEKWLEMSSKEIKNGKGYHAFAIFRRARSLGVGISSRFKIKRSRLS